MKRSLFVALAISCLCQLQAQEDLITGFSLNPYQVKDSLISQLDLSTITTGLLLDRSVPLIKIKEYTGTATSDTLRDFYAWNDLYNTLQNSEISANAGPPAGSTWTDEVDALMASGTIPFRSLHYNYHASVGDSTQLYQLIYWDGQYFQDVPGRPTDPWVLHQAFGAGPAKTKFLNTLEVEFIIKPEYFFSNMGKTVDQIEVDFGYGAGLQPITLNEAFTVTWHSV